MKLLFVSFQILFGFSFNISRQFYVVASRLLPVVLRIKLLIAPYMIYRGFRSFDKGKYGKIRLRRTGYLIKSIKRKNLPVNVFFRLKVYFLPQYLARNR